MMNRESIELVVRAEPERSKLLLKVAGGVALGMSLWAWIGSAIMSDIPFFVLTLLAMAAAEAGLMLMAGRIVDDTHNWQAETALNARRLMTSPPRREAGRPGSDYEPAAAAVPDIAPQPVAPAQPAPASFDQWYFVLRLEDEIKRARRLGTQISVVMMKIMTPTRSPSAALTEQVNFDVAQLAANHAKTMAMPSAIGPLEYGFILEDCDRKEARARIAPLLGPLGDYRCEFGVASYPEDGTVAESLVAIAREEIEEAMVASLKGKAA